MKIIPLIVGKIDCAQAQRIAKLVKPFVTRNTLVIVTTDFTHYGKAYQYTPFTDHVAYRIRDLDSRAITFIEAGDCHKFAEFIKQSGATICGHYPLQILLALLKAHVFGDVEPRLIAYDTSGRQTKSLDPSVSYVGMLFTQEKLEELPIEDQLTAQEARGLIEEAHDVLYSIYDHNIPEELLYPLKSFGVMQHHGAFATLETITKAGKQLRGCIGKVTSSEPLYKTVADVTRDTALHDPRFAPVTQQELPQLALKLSILSDIHEIADYSNIVLGKDGIILTYHGQSALFLPEVPGEFHWNLQQTLQELSSKAGLAKNIWKQKDTKFSVFNTLDIDYGK